MIESIIEWDREMMVAMNIPASHSPSLDLFFFAVSKIFIWLPIFGFLLYTIAKTKKKESLFIFIGIILVFLLTDRITSGLMKPYFARLRPSHDPMVMESLRYAFDYTGGRYGFPSSHAGNSFAFATFLSLLFRNKLMTVTVGLWACLCSYSRLYLGVHFPVDIMVGAVTGCLIGWLSYWIYTCLANRFPQYSTTEKFDNRSVALLSFVIVAQIFTMYITSVTLK